MSMFLLLYFAVVVFGLGLGQEPCFANPEGVLMAYFRQLQTLLYQETKWQEMVKGIKSDEHLVALRHSKESLVRLAGGKVMERVLELGIALGLDWQAELDKLQASRKPKR